MANFKNLTKSEIHELQDMFEFFEMIEGFYDTIKKDTKYKKVFKKIHKYEHAYGFYTWLYRITVNCCIDYLRKANRKIKTVPLAQLDHWDQSESARDQEIPDEKFCPESEFWNMELRDILNNAVSKLPEILRSAIVLKHIEGFSYAEIAAIFNCSIGTVKSRMHRAREELKMRLTPYLN